MAPGLFQHAHQRKSGAAPGSGEPPGIAEPELRPSRSGLTRRAFLVRGSLAAGAAALIGSVPGVGNILTTAESESPEIEGVGGSAAGAGAAAAAGTEFGPEMSQPIVAHVIDLSTGEINLYQGTA